MAKKTKKPPAKPTQRTFKCWDYHDVMDYVGKKYGFNPDDYAGKFHKKKYDESVPYLNFWHWFTEDLDIHNGSIQYLSVTENLEDEDTPKWVKEILQHVYNEFGEDEMEMWVAW